MFWLPKTDQPDYYVLIAAAGNPDSAKVFIELLNEAVTEQFPAGHATLQGLKKAHKGSAKAAMA